MWHNQELMFFGIDGQVRLVRLKKDDFRWFLRKQKGQTTNFRLRDEQTGYAPYFHGSILLQSV